MPFSVLISMNPFKGHLTNLEACEAVASSLEQKGIRYEILPSGDGGRGTMWAVQKALEGKIFSIQATGCALRPVQARLLCIPSADHPAAVFVESSEVCGHHLMDPANRNALLATSFGLGECLQVTLSRWKDSLKEIFIGLGDSAVSDAGMGMLCALGYQFVDKAGKSLSGNAANLEFIEAIEPPVSKPWESLLLTILCDVSNPLCGPNGSARTFAPQKGATPEQVKRIEAGMENFAQKVRSLTGRQIGNLPMTGSAGGLSGAFFGVLGSQLVPGSKFLFDWIGFDSVLSRHTLVITGEGKTDGQTLRGKGPMESLKRAEKLGKKALIISGALGEGYEPLLQQPSVVGCYACGNIPNAKEALKRKTLEIFSDSKFLED